MKKLMLFVFSAMFVVGVSSVHAQNIDGWNVTNARLDGMGLQNWQTDDDFNIWSNPAFINTYSNRGYGELGDYDANVYGTRDMNNETVNPWGGANYKTSVGTFGLYLGRSYTGNIVGMGNGVGSVSLPYSPPTSPKNPDNKFDLFYGTELGDIALLGVRLNYNTYSNETTSDTGPATAPPATNPKTTLTGETTWSSRDINLTVGVALKALPIDVSLSLGLPSLTSKDKSYSETVNTGTSVTTTINNQDTLESDGAMNIGLLVRGKLLKTEDSVLLTTLRIDSTDNSSKVTSKYDYTSSSTASSSIYTDSRSSKREDSTIFLGLDTAYNKKINDKNLFVGVIGLDYSSRTRSLVNTVNDNKLVDSAGTITYSDPIGSIDGEDIEEDRSIISIPLRIAFENQTTKKISTRLGISKPLYQRKTTKTTTKRYYTTGPVTGQRATAVNYKIEDENILSLDEPTSISLGATVKFTDSLLLDATVNQDVLFTGTYLLSGIENTLFGKISLIYIF